MAYEYKKVKTNAGDHYLSERELNEFGADGWIMTAYNDMEDCYIFMREVLRDVDSP